MQGIALLANCKIMSLPIKDGRTSKFNISLPLKLKNIVLGLGDFKIKIKEIKFNNRHNQESDYNEYIDYVYDVVIEKVSG